MKNLQSHHHHESDTFKNTPLFESSNLNWITSPIFFASLLHWQSQADYALILQEDFIFKKLKWKSKPIAIPFKRTYIYSAFNILPCSIKLFCHQ